MKMKTKESRINLAKRVISQTYIWNAFFISLIAHIQSNQISQGITKQQETYTLFALLCCIWKFWTFKKMV